MTATAPARPRAPRVGRPRQVEDEAIYAAMAAVLLRVGWARLTVSLVAREVGITPAALRQRFGGKHELLVAFYAWGTAHLRETLFDPRDLPPQRSPLEVLYTTIRGGVEPIATPQQLVNALSAFSEVAGEPDLRGLAQQRVQLAVRTFQQLLQLAEARGELVSLDAHQMAVQLHAGMIGACFVWAVMGRGSLSDQVKSAVDELLAPYRSGPRTDA